MRGLGLLALLMAGPLAAQDLPALYDVSDVADFDVLNVRVAPDASAEMIGELAPDATGIEVTAAEDGWGRVNVNGQSGWASLSFLTRVVDQWPDGQPAPESCFGTEPFWTLSFDGPDMTFEQIDAEGQTGLVTHRARSVNRTDRFLIAGDLEGTHVTATLSRQSCSDGMSDQLFGLSSEIVIGGTLYSGCCTMQSR